MGAHRDIERRNADVSRTLIVIIKEKRQLAPSVTFTRKDHQRLILFGHCRRLE